jgi:hypothetical protein
MIENNPYSHKIDPFNEYNHKIQEKGMSTLEFRFACQLMKEISNQ